jgi:hypothetical protein
VYCSQCGVKADGKFCYQCGAPLNATARPGGHPIDWSECINYEELFRVTEVRDLIAQHSALAKKRMSAEEFLGIRDNVFSPVKGLSWKTIVAVAQPMFAAMGVKTGKTRSQVFARPAGTVLVASLCSLARRGRPLR